ncbi:MAG: hypothetical protein DMG17_25805 [Acidobacteria bacterium]|nr:MAG: hypothetical protein DMG17_25805 [Acidobacteriota bacterium]
MIEGGKQFQPELFRKYLRVLAQVALRSRGALQNKIDASDLVQSALLQAIEALPQFRGQTDQEFAAWLRRILANKLADKARHFRRQKRDAALEESYRETLDDSARRLEQIPADLTTPSRHVMQNERARYLADHLAALPSDQQMAMELHHLAGYSISEIAERMAKSKASVAGLLRRGLEQLREDLKHKEKELR